MGWTGERWALVGKKEGLCIGIARIRDCRIPETKGVGL